MTESQPESKDEQREEKEVAITEEESQESSEAVEKPSHQGESTIDNDNNNPLPAETSGESPDSEDPSPPADQIPVGQGAEEVVETFPTEPNPTPLETPESTPAFDLIEPPPLLGPMSSQLSTMPGALVEDSSQFNLPSGEDPFIDQPHSTLDGPLDDETAAAAAAAAMAISAADAPDLGADKPKHRKSHKRRDKSEKPEKERKHRDKGEREHRDKSEKEHRVREPKEPREKGGKEKRHKTPEEKAGKETRRAAKLAAKFGAIPPTITVVDDEAVNGQYDLQPSSVEDKTKRRRRRSKVGISADGEPEVTLAEEQPEKEKRHRQKSGSKKSGGETDVEDGKRSKKKHSHTHMTSEEREERRKRHEEKALRKGKELGNFHT